MTEDPNSAKGSNEGRETDAPDTIPGEGEAQGTGSELLDEALAALEGSAVSVEGVIPEEAMFSPDDPILKEGEERGVVTGMGGEGIPSDRPLDQIGDLAWEIRHAANIMNGLATALKEHGMEALKVHSDTEPMDAVLRSFIAGYLVGRTDPEE